MAKLPWYFKVTESGKDHVTFKLRRIYVLWVWIKIKLRVIKFDKHKLDYNG